jgi:hypothetical protein
MGKRVIAMLAAALLATFALAACGGDDDNGDSSSADEDGITKAIEAAAASGDPSACTQYQTQNFLEQTNGETGQAAVKSCEEDADEGVADTVDVSDIEVDGSSATAKAAVTGSTFDGQTLDIALVKEGDVWKLDKFNGFEDFDKDAMVASFKEELSSDPSLPAGAADCVAQQFEKASSEDIEAFFTESNQESEDQFFKPCEDEFKGQ